MERVGYMDQSIYIFELKALDFKNVKTFESIYDNKSNKFVKMKTGAIEPVWINKIFCTNIPAKKLNFNILNGKESIIIIEINSAMYFNVTQTVSSTTNSIKLLSEKKSRIKIY